MTIKHLLKTSCRDALASHWTVSLAVTLFCGLGISCSRSAPAPASPSASSNSASSAASPGSASDQASDTPSAKPEPTLSSANLTQTTNPQFGVSPSNDLLANATAVTASSEDWSRFLGPTFDGKSTEKGILTDWSSGKLPLLWTAPVGTSYGIGSVAADRYLQHERSGDVERLHAMDANTGQSLWQNDHPVQYQDMYGYNDGPRDTPAIVGDKVYAYGVAGRLTCVELSTGATVWQVDTNSKYGVIQNFFGVGSSPLVVDDLVIVMVGGSPDEDQSIAPGRLDRVSPNGSALVALDRLTGEERWRAGDDLASYSSPRLMTIAGEPVVIAFCRDVLLAVHARTGKVLWQFHHRASILESVNGMTPVVLGDRIFISDCYAVGSALLEPTLTECKVVWQDPENRREQLFRAHWATPIAVGDFLYGSSGRNEPDSDLRCIDWKTQKLMWSDERRSRCSLLCVDQHFVVLDERGELELIAVDSAGFKKVTSLNLEDGYGDCPPLGTPYWAAPILSQGRLYIRGSRGVACFRLIAQTESSD